MIIRFSLIFILFSSLSFADYKCCELKYIDHDKTHAAKMLGKKSRSISSTIKESKKNTCDFELSSNDIQVVFQDLIDEYFHALKNIEISIKYFDDDAYFFAAGTGNVLKGKAKRKYSIKVSKAILDGRVCAPPPKAVRSIMAHELFHIQDYVEKGFFKMIGLGVKYLPLNRRARIKYERLTDKRVLELGYNKQDQDLIDGLAEYRHWVYKPLNKRQLKVKKKMYFSPEDIENWLSEKEGR